MSVKALPLFFCLLGSLSFVQAQNVAPRRWEFGAGIGVFMYQGDLAPAKLGGYKDPKPGLNLFAARLMSRSLALRGQFTLAALKTDESKYSVPAWRQQRNLAFRTGLAEFSVLAVWHPKADLMNEDIYVRKLSPYIFAGGGLTVMGVSRDFSRFNASYFESQPSVIAGVAADALKRPARIIPVVPVGVGVRYPLTEKFSLMAETAYRFSFNDYMDGVSLAGNPVRKDHYYSVSVGVIYRPWRNKGIGCPANW